MPTEDILRISSLRKAFGSKRVLDIGALNFAPGLSFILGPNGSGKTTFFKCLAGVHPFEGSAVLAGGIELQRHRMAQRKAIAYCPAEPLFPSFLSGQELADFVVRTKGLPAAATEPLIDALQMRDFLGSKVGTYSSGMKKKLGLLLAMAGQPPLILLDEPTSALDQASRHALAGLIRQGLDQGSSFLIASHASDLHAAFGAGQAYLLRDLSFHAVSAAEAQYWLSEEEAEHGLEAAR